jgi:hypothetical protein
VQIILNAHLVGEIFTDDSLLSLLLKLMRDKEYSLAKSSSEFFRNLSRFFSEVKLAESAEKLDVGKVFSSLASLDQSDDIFALNLESLHNLLKSSYNA